MEVHFNTIIFLRYSIHAYTYACIYACTYVCMQVYFAFQVIDKNRSKRERFLEILNRGGAD